MKRSDIPSRFPKPFAADAGGGFVRDVPTDPTAQEGAASLNLGFPPACFLPVGAGGVPPFGQDMNGVLKQTTAWSRWQGAGGAVGYDAGFSAAIGGYPEGTVLAAAAFGAYWLCLVDDNVSNPDASGAGWLGYVTENTYPVAGGFSNLAGSAAGGTKSASWTMSEIVAGVALGGRTYKGASLTLTFDGSGTGAGGMDTGAVPTAASMSVYAIYDPATATWSTLGTVASSGPVYGGANMPAGYTASALLWSGITAGGFLNAFSQTDRTISAADVVVINGGFATTFTAVNAAALLAVPPNAKTAIGYAPFNGTNTLTLSPTVGGAGQIKMGGGAFTWPFQVACPGGQFFYKVNNSTIIIDVTGYTI